MLRHETRQESGRVRELFFVFWFVVLLLFSQRLGVMLEYVENFGLGNACDLIVLHCLSHNFFHILYSLLKGRSLDEISGELALFLFGFLIECDD